jgi:hypothetical protein
VRTVPVSRHVLLIADVPVDTESELVGQAVQDCCESNSGLPKPVVQSYAQGRSSPLVLMSRE